MEKFHTFYEVISGSRAYGFANEDSDTDIRGIAFPSIETFFGLGNFEMAETKDPDRQIYSLKKFMNLALNANPNILELLFIDNQEFIIKETNYSNCLKENREIFISKRIFTTYMGYVKAQISKLKAAGNCSPQMNSRRAEGIKKHGYDVKAAAHVVRLLHQGIDLALSKQICFPMNQLPLETIINIRKGFMSLDNFIEYSDTLLDIFKGLEETSDLPERADHKKAEELTYSLHYNFYNDYHLNLYKGQ